MVTINIVLYAIKEIKNLDILKTVDMMARNPSAIYQQIDLRELFKVITKKGFEIIPVIDEKIMIRLLD